MAGTTVATMAALMVHLKVVQRDVSMVDKTALR